MNAMRGMALNKEVDFNKYDIDSLIMLNIFECRIVLSRIKNLQ
mgnify:CR=1 FL=1